MLKITSILGARPQFIKASALSRGISTFNKNSEKIRETIIHTGQHFDKRMSNIFFKELKIPSPKYNLRIGGGSHGENTGRMIEKIEKKILKESPDLCIIYGDTDSTLAAAIAASKLNIPIAHIEAGLRSGNKNMPEEINRILADHCSDFLFCPTLNAVKNLRNEGFSQKKVFNVGDIMFDNFLYYKMHQKRPSKLSSDFYHNFIFCTIHRAENTEKKEYFFEIISLLNKLSKEKKILFSAHPRTKKLLSSYKDLNISKNINLINPLSMFETFWALNNCSYVLTDSGGLQKEAYFAKKKCITLRDQTEWIELLDLQANLLLPPLSKNKDEKILKFKSKKTSYTKKPYGKGEASKKILSIIHEIL